MEMDSQIQTSEPSQDANDTSINTESTVENQVDAAPPAETPEAAKVDAEAKKVSFADSIKKKIAQSSAGETPAAYNPNFKFKVLDKELEFDELLRPLITNKEIEDKVRELYSKGHGIDHIKEQRQALQEKLGKLEPQYTSLNKGLDMLNSMVQKGDYFGFFNALKIPEEDILKYALSRVKYKELPPEQRAEQDRAYQEQQRLGYLENSNQQLLEMYQNQAVSQRSNELDSYLSRADIGQVVQAFDARVGQPGAFRDEVIKRGQYYASVGGGKDISVEQAVNEVMHLLGGAAQKAPSVNPATVAAQQAKPVIPNIKGRGTSPTKQAIRSVKDLKKFAANFQE